MFCGNCGTQLEDGSTVCSKCGFKFVADLKPENNKDAEKAAEKAEKEAKKAAEKAAKEAEKAAKKAAEEAAKEQQKEIINVDTTTNVQPVVPVDNSNMGGNGKKKSKAPIIIAASIAGVIVILALIFLLTPTLRNGIKKAFMSDVSYYKSAQKDAFMDIADMALNQYGVLVSDTDVKNLEVSLNANLVVEDEAEDFLDKLDDQERTDLTWLKKAALSASIGSKDSMLFVKGDLDVNKKDIIEIDTKINVDDGVMYLGVPSLSDTYAAIESFGGKRAHGSSDGDYYEYGETRVSGVAVMAEVLKVLPKQKDAKKIVEKYVDIFLDSIKKVKSSDDKSLKVSGVTVDGCTKVAVKFDSDDVNELRIKILEAIMDDSDIASIMNKLDALDEFNISYDDMLDAYDRELERLKSYSGDNNDEIRIEVYIDSTGDIISFDITESKNGGSTNGGIDISYGYKYAENDGKYGFELYSNNASRSRIYTDFGVKASGSISGSKLTGSVVFIENNRESEKLEYEDLNLSSLLEGEIDGDFVFNLYEKSGEKIFKNIVLKIKADDASAKSGKVVIALYDSSVEIASLNIDYKKGTASSVKAPSKTEDMSNPTDLLDWMDSFKWDKTIDNMESAELPKKAIRAIEALSKGDFTVIRNILGISLPGVISIPNIDYYDEY